jgi:hypothetical protein
LVFGALSAAWRQNDKAMQRCLPYSLRDKEDAVFCRLRSLARSFAQPPAFVEAISSQIYDDVALACQQVWTRKSGLTNQGGTGNDHVDLSSMHQHNHIFYNSTNYHSEHQLS